MGDHLAEQEANRIAGEKLSILRKVCLGEERFNIRAAVLEAMQACWDDFVNDTGCYPNDFTVSGGKHRVEFKAGQWAHHVAEAVAAKLVKP